MGRGGRISLEDFIALNDEIKALAASGLPLDQGLMAVGADVGGRLGAVSVSIGRRLESGASLADAVEAEGDRLPRLYRALIAAGARSGRLPLVLEGLASFARSYQEARRSLGLALLYPLIVLCFAYGLFVMVVARVLPLFESAFLTFGVPLGVVPRTLAAVGRSTGLWWPIGPAFLAAGFVLWWTSGAARGMDPISGRRFLSMFPWMRSLLDSMEAANFSELLALLLENEVPLHDALVLASDVAGDRSLGGSGRALAAVIERGGDAARALRELPRGRRLPPLLGWLVTTPRAPAALVESLHRLSMMYRRRSQRLSELISTLLPSMLLVAVGGSAVLLYALCLFEPLATMLRELSGV